MNCVKKNRANERISEVELTALRALWETGPVRARELHESLDASSRRSYSTMRKALECLVERRLAVKLKDRHVSRYEARISRAEYVVAEVRRLAKDLVGVPAIEFMRVLAQSRELTREDLVIIEERLSEE